MVELVLEMDRGLTVGAPEKIMSSWVVCTVLCLGVVNESVMWQCSAVTQAVRTKNKNLVIVIPQCVEMYTQMFLQGRISTVLVVLFLLSVECSFFFCSFINVLAASSLRAILVWIWKNS